MRGRGGEEMMGGGEAVFRAQVGDGGCVTAVCFVQTWTDRFLQQ